MSTLEPNQNPAPEPQFSSETQGSHNKNRPLPWLGGAILILVGVIFLLGQLTSFRLNNWWALFILIPAFGSFAGAWGAYRKHERFNRAVRSSLIGGIILTAVALIFLFELDMGRYWPVFVIIAGVASLLSGLIKDDVA
jgi:O-antigen/teichoic acid export membrane protein